MKDIIQDEKNYYLFRALNMSDNEDLEKGFITDKKGKYTKIRTDKQRWEENKDNPPSKYSNSTGITLEEVYDHIKENYRRDTNCISLSSSASISEKYGENYKDNYIMVRIPKEEFGKKLVDAEEYIIETSKIKKEDKLTNEMIANIEKRANESEEFLYYGEIKGKNIIKISKETLKDFALLQQEKRNEEIMDKIEKLYNNDKKFNKEDLQKIGSRISNVQICDELDNFLKAKEKELEEGEKQINGKNI